MVAPKAPLLDAAGKKSKDLTLEEDVFAAEVKPHLVHEAVRAEFAEHRSGTKSVKNRSRVSGGRSKPWRQKGTGRARQGTTRAAQWKGGGVAFAPRTVFDVKLNKKEFRAALRAALTDHAQAGSFAVLSADGWDAPSTQKAVALLADREFPVLVVATEDESALGKSFRNLEKVIVTVPSELEVSELVWASSLLVSEAALPLVQGRAS